MTDEGVRLERDAGTAVLIINRPASLNALNRAVLTAIGEAVASIRPGSDRALIITGAGEKAFCAGADLDELRGLSEAAAAETIRFGHGVMGGIERCPVPVIAAVNGLALGGGFELALASSIIIGSTRAALALPETRLGLLPGYGGTQRLTRAIGRHAANYHVVTGARISADRAYQLGLLAIAPVPPPDLIATARAIAADIAQGGPVAVESALRLSQLALAAPVTDGMQAEAAAAAAAIAGREGGEGIDAFLSKRAPIFTRSS